MNSVIKPYNPPPPDYAFEYKKLPDSGNAINGLGETKKRRAKHIFHNPGDLFLAWGDLNDFFTMINPWSVVKHLLGNLWVMRARDGEVASQQREVSDTKAMAEEIKTLARKHGASLVGITYLEESDVFEGRTIPYKNVICLGMPMDREEMKYVPQEPAATEVLRVYKEVSRSAMKLAVDIRAMGWPAKAYGEPNSSDLLHLPIAIKAGLGELGKHGSIISKEFGSNFRLAAVVTDLPLDFDSSSDIGVEDLCLSCRRCVTDCPPDAISDEKQLVRGEKKWYVDFDKCVPYFVKTFGCAICIQVCPWSVPGRGPKLSEKMLAKRSS